MRDIEIGAASVTATLTDELPAEVELRQAQHSCRAHLNDVWDSGAEG
jgi:hypothetical protein